VIAPDGRQPQIEPEVRKVTLEGSPAIYERSLTTQRTAAPRWIEVHLLPHLGEQRESFRAPTC
jgi:hypothetical protein